MYVIRRDETRTWSELEVHKDRETSYVPRTEYRLMKLELFGTLGVLCLLQGSVQVWTSSVSVQYSQTFFMKKKFCVVVLGIDQSHSYCLMTSVSRVLFIYLTLHQRLN